jgi:hypothetical protein
MDFTLVFMKENTIDKTSKHIFFHITNTNDLKNLYYVNYYTLKRDSHNKVFKTKI